MTPEQLNEIRERCKKATLGVYTQVGNPLNELVKSRAYTHLALLSPQSLTASTACGR